MRFPPDSSGGGVLGIYLRKDIDFLFILQLSVGKDPLSFVVVVVAVIANVFGSGSFSSGKQTRNICSVSSVVCTYAAWEMKNVRLCSFVKVCIYQMTVRKKESPALFLCRLRFRCLECTKSTPL